MSSVPFPEMCTGPVGNEVQGQHERAVLQIYAAIFPAYFTKQQTHERRP